MAVICKWSSCLYVDPWAFSSYFVPLSCWGGLVSEQLGGRSAVSQVWPTAEFLHRLETGGADAGCDHIKTHMNPVVVWDLLVYVCGGLWNMFLWWCLSNANSTVGKVAAVGGGLTRCEFVCGRHSVCSVCANWQACCAFAQPCCMAN